MSRIEAQAMRDRRIKDIQAHFTALIGERIIRYETAELLLGDGTWESWPDLPIRLCTESGRVVAISWPRFEDLWLTDHLSLPFPIGDSTVRWVVNGLEAIDTAVGASIRSVRLGQGEMTIGGRGGESWATGSAGWCPSERIEERGKSSSGPWNEAQVATAAE